MQTSYSNQPVKAREGLIADNRTLKHIQGKITVGAVKAGVGVFRVPGYGTAGTRMADPGQCYQTPSPAAAADVDAFLSGGASSGSIQTITTFNGVQGTDVLLPARKATLVLSSHADWNATTAVLTYYDEDGVLVSEDLAIPDAGNATVTSVGYVSQIVSLVIPAQAAGGGTFTVGISILDGTVDLTDFLGVAVLTPMVVPASTASTDAYEYADETVIDVLVKGAIWVDAEDSPTEGAAAYVRIGSGAGGTQLGAFRSDADTASAVAVTGAKFGKTVDGLTKLELF